MSFVCFCFCLWMQLYPSASNYLGMLSLLNASSAHSCKEKRRWAAWLFLPSCLWFSVFFSSKWPGPLRPPSPSTGIGDSANTPRPLSWPLTIGTGLGAVPIPASQVETEGWCPFLFLLKWYLTVSRNFKPKDTFLTASALDIFRLRKSLRLQRHMLGVT